MDPIHPITPRPPGLAPEAGGWEPNPSDRAARDRREQRRRERERRARERGGPQQESNSPYSPDDDGPRHIDVRA